MRGFGRHKGAKAFSVSGDPRSPGSSRVPLGWYTSPAARPGSPSPIRGLHSACTPGGRARRPDAHRRRRVAQLVALVALVAVVRVRARGAGSADEVELSKKREEKGGGEGSPLLGGDAKPNKKVAGW